MPGAGVQPLEPPMLGGWRQSTDGPIDVQPLEPLMVGRLAPFERACPIKLQPARAANARARGPFHSNRQCRIDPMPSGLTSP
jgi:hypothetical protein